MKTPKGFTEAVTKIRSSNMPLTLWWRPVLKGNAVNEVLALPAYSRRPSAGVRVSIFEDDADVGTIKAAIAELMIRYRDASRATRKRCGDSRT